MISSRILKKCLVGIQVINRPGTFCIISWSYMILLLAIDLHTNLTQQIILSITTWLFLGVSFIYLTPIERSRTLIVIVIATLGEVLGSIVWGIYEYRLGNLPFFVPPGHGIIYLSGLRLSQVSWATKYKFYFVRVATIGVVIWAILGLTILERKDIAGAVGAIFILAFLYFGKARSLYAGVFYAVASLEIYGTSLGNWTWAEQIPSINVMNGNPPSGIASGYILFDIVALYLGQPLLALSSEINNYVGFLKIKSQSLIH